MFPGSRGGVCTVSHVDHEQIHVWLITGIITLNQTALRQCWANWGRGVRRCSVPLTCMVSVFLFLSILHYRNQLCTSLAVLPYILYLHSPWLLSRRCSVPLTGSQSIIVTFPFFTTLISYISALSYILSIYMRTFSVMMYLRMCEGLL